MIALLKIPSHSDDNENKHMNCVKVVVAGSTGTLGKLIVKSLVERKAQVVAMVRLQAAKDNIKFLENLGARVVEVDFKNRAHLENACSGASCVVSALSGLREVIVDAQTELLQAAIEARVPRFIPSDYSADFTKLAPGTNRNFDLRREFHKKLETSSIAATTIFNGMFTDMLTGQAPFILFKLKRVLYWQNADQKMDFTTMDNTAAFTAAAALDLRAPRFLHIAGDEISARELANLMTEISGKQFSLLNAGSLKMLGFLISLVRTIAPQKEELYPPWQGMQYMHNMYGGLTKAQHIDNDRYSGITWTKVKDILISLENGR